MLSLKTCRLAKRATMSVRPLSIPVASPDWSCRRRRGRRPFRKAGDLTGKSGNGHLKVVLERGDGALGMGEGGDEMAQGHGVGMTVGFARRSGNQPQTCADMAGEITPSGEPAAGGA